MTHVNFSKFPQTYETLSFIINFMHALRGNKFPNSKDNRSELTLLQSYLFRNNFSPLPIKEKVDVIRFYFYGDLANKRP